jgi:IclR family pca regulon transcriptional regulator
VAIRDNHKDIVISFMKGLNVIKAFNEENVQMTLSDISKKVDITRSNARRLLLTLEVLGYVKQHNNYFSLTPKVLELGYSYFASLPWTDLAYENMKNVVNKCNLSCSISILDDTHIICIMRVQSKGILNEGIHVGTRLPSAYTSTGRIFMSNMDNKKLKAYIKRLPLKKYTQKSIIDTSTLYETIIANRKNSYQLVEEELEDGLLSIAVPIYGYNNKLIAAINIGSHGSYKDISYLKETVLPILLKAGQDITKSICLLSI